MKGSALFENDVPALGQISDDGRVRIVGREGADLKIAFFGNSITRHGRAEALGWQGDWGMAASSRGKDYVHRLLTYLEEDGRRPACCTANLSEWERTRDMRLLEEGYAAAFAFGADIAVLRLGENAQLQEHLAAFERCYVSLAEKLQNGGAKVVLTDLFWAFPPFDSFVRELARERGYAFASISDLGAKEEMRAADRFAHAGVALHPGDRGMEEIARRLHAAIVEARF